MSGFGAAGGGGGSDDSDNIVEAAGADDQEAEDSTASPLSEAHTMLADDMVDDEPESLDMTEARRLGSLPADELLARLETSDASPKTKFVAVTLRIEQHQAQYNRLCRAKEVLAAPDRPPWWRQYIGAPSDYRMFDSRYAAYARGKAHSAFHSAGGTGPFAAVTTAKDAARFAAQQVVSTAAHWLFRLARRFE